MDWLVHARQRVFTRFEHFRLANLQGTQGVRTKCQIQGVSCCSIMPGPPSRIQSATFFAKWVKGKMCPRHIFAMSGNCLPFEQNMGCHQLNPSAKAG